MPSIYPVCLASAIVCRQFGNLSDRIANQPAGPADRPGVCPLVVALIISLLDKPGHRTGFLGRDASCRLFCCLSIQLVLCWLVTVRFTAKQLKKDTMRQLRRRMIQDLKLRGFVEKTQQSDVATATAA